MARRNKETEIVSIPGLKGREAKEISFKKIVTNYSCTCAGNFGTSIFGIEKLRLREDQNKKLIAGIVLTGGGYQIKTHSST